MQSPWLERPDPKSTSRPSVAAMTFFMLVGLLIVFMIFQIPWRGLTSQPSRREQLSLAEQAFQYGDDHEAAVLFENLAKTGNATAEYWLAHMMEFGLGVPHNSATAIKLYKKAAEQNFTKAEVRLGEIYLDGNLVSPNPQKAKKNLDKAAYRGNAHAALLLGQVYRDGIGVPIDPTRADAWFEVANLEGSKVARRERGISFRDLKVADQQSTITRTQDILNAIKKTTPGKPANNLKKNLKSVLRHQVRSSHIS